MPRRPVLSPSAHVALLVLVVAGVLALAAWSGPAQLAAGLAAAGIVLAWGWAGTLAVPSPRGSATVLALAAVTLTGSVVVPSDGARADLLAPTVGLVVVAALLQQLLRRDGRPRLVESITAVVFGVLLLTAGALLVPVAEHPEGRLLVVAALLAGVAAAVTDTAGRWRRFRPWVVPGAMLAGAGVAVATGRLGEADAHWSVYLLLGVLTAAVGHAVRAVLSVLPTMAHARPRLVAAVASVLVSGAVVYAVTRLLAPDLLGG